MHTSTSLGDKDEQPYSLEQVRPCAEPQYDGEKQIDELGGKTCGLRSLAAYHGVVRRRAKNVSSLKARCARALRRVWRSKADSQNTISSASMREAKAALVEAPDVDVHQKALRVMGELVDIQRQPRSLGPRHRGSVPLVHRPRGGALQDHRNTNTEIANDARASDLESTHGGLDDGWHRRCETTAHVRHNVVFAEQNKPRTGSIGAGTKALKENKSAEGFCRSDADVFIMPSRCDATAPAGRQLLDEKASIELDHEKWEPANKGRKDIKDSEQMSVSLFRDGDDCYDQLITLDLAIEINSHVEEGSQNAESPPEMDSGYDTSESDRSVAEQLAEQYLKPLHSMLDLLPTDVNNRFGSYYSPTSETRPGLQAWPERGYDVCDENQYQSRFSCTSSIYSDDGQEERSTWWKSVGPLVVKKELERPPPIPKKNPLRLLRRMSKDKLGGYNEESRGSRNIHNLHLDLSRSNLRNARKSIKSPKSTRKNSRKAAKLESEKSTSKKPQLRLVIPGHLSNAICNSIEAGMKARQSTRASTSSSRYSSTHSAREATGECKTSRTTTAQSRNRSSKDTPARSLISLSATSQSNSRSHSARYAPVETPRLTPASSGYAETLHSARGHTRGSSEPLRSGVSDVSSRWNASMPSHEPVRKSCITRLVNDGTTKRKASHAAAINKQLPPLPVDMKL